MMEANSFFPTRLVNAPSVELPCGMFAPMMVVMSMMGNIYPAMQTCLFCFRTILFLT